MSSTLKVSDPSLAFHVSVQSLGLNENLGILSNFHALSCHLYFTYWKIYKLWLLDYVLGVFIKVLCLQVIAPKKLFVNECFQALVDAVLNFSHPRMSFGSCTANELILLNFSSVYFQKETKIPISFLFNDIDIYQVTIFH